MGSSLIKLGKQTEIHSDRLFPVLDLNLIRF